MKIHGIYSQRFQRRWLHRITYTNGRVVFKFGKLQ